MAHAVSLPLSGDREVNIISTARADGDFAVTSEGVAARRRSLIDANWTWLQLQHGTDVIPVGRPGSGAGAAADGGWTVCENAPIGVTSADCAPVVVAASGANGAALAVVHAGWKGLLHGIIEVAAGAVLGAAGADPTTVAFCGPCIGPQHYAFSHDDLQPFRQRFGSEVLSLTNEGEPALDMFAGVALSLERSGFARPNRPASTADPTYFSHRVRKDAERMVTVAHLTSGGL